MAAARAACRQRATVPAGEPGLRWLERASPRGDRHVGAWQPTLAETAIVDFAARRADAAEVGSRGPWADPHRSARSTRSTRTPAPDGRSRPTGRPSTGDRVIVCAGLQADRLAEWPRQPAEPRIVPFRGEYWQLRRRARRPGPSALIYPVPDPELPFLGVHLTRKIDGTVVLGPNAILSTGRHAYDRRQFVLRDTYDALSWPGTLRMLRRHWRAGVGEVIRSVSKRRFVARRGALRARRWSRRGRAPRAGRGAGPGDRSRRLAGRRLSTSRQGDVHLGAQRALTRGHLIAGHRRGAGQPCHRQLTPPGQAGGLGGANVRRALRPGGRATRRRPAAPGGPARW